MASGLGMVNFENLHEGTVEGKTSGKRHGA
jgi:hypothetical protein